MWKYATFSTIHNSERMNGKDWQIELWSTLMEWIILQVKKFGEKFKHYFLFWRKASLMFTLLRLFYMCTFICQSL